MSEGNNSIVIAKRHVLTKGSSCSRIDSCVRSIVIKSHKKMTCWWFPWQSWSSFSSSPCPGACSRGWWLWWVLWVPEDPTLPQWQSEWGYYCCPAPASGSRLPCTPRDSFGNRITTTLGQGMWNATYWTKAGLQNPKLVFPLSTILNPFGFVNKLNFSVKSPISLWNFHLFSLIFEPLTSWSLNLSLTPYSVMTSDNFHCKIRK